ncbi:DUF4003 family protein [Clostridium uliginosum]|uniref:DUF4003 domain-containing protein n=1 Tax=Clostridium uliginosum TaxID=119641 RepID=A0A1I1RZU5_9CLOT|nr:DUF4003 family protein [Clostridium uliginosum]SFD39795.1 Protein of unknown function [Clostridium uliginosum]
MDIDLRSKVIIFKEYYKDVNKVLRLESNKIKNLESFLYTTTDEEIDYEKTKEIKKYIKKSELGYVFSGDIRKIISIFLFSNDNYKKIIKDTIIIYDHLISKGFEKDKFTAFISFSISNRFHEKEYDNIIKKMIYIKRTLEFKEHIKYKTNIKYLCFLNLATFTKSSKEILEDYLNIYDKLINEGFSETETFYSVSTLILSDNKNYVERLNKVKDIKRVFQNNNIIICEEYYLLIGLSSLIVEKTEKFVGDVIEVYNQFAEKKHSKKNIFMLLSIGLVLNEYIQVISTKHMNSFIQGEVNLLSRLIEYITILLI